MNSAEKFSPVNPIQGNQVQVGNIPTTNAYPGMENRTQINSNILPLDVTTELAQYQRIFVTKEFDYFKIVHRCEDYLHDYKVFGELPDGDKKLLFTVSRHFECKCCWDNCIIPLCLCAYVCCNSIVFQLDYKRNGNPFFTQGINIQKGFYCCKCYCPSCCSCCTRSDYLDLRENNQPDNPDFNYGTYKGTTRVTTNCCVPEYTANYINVDKSNGPAIRAKCCDVCKKRCLRCCCGCEYDFEMDIEDGNGNKSGNIMIYTGCYSEKVKDFGICYSPRPYYEINLPSLATSEQKFQIVADLIHFDLTNGAL